jgi:hypothetical protein
LAVHWAEPQSSVEPRERSMRLETSLATPNGAMQAEVRPRHDVARMQRRASRSTGDALRMHPLGPLREEIHCGRANSAIFSGTGGRRSRSRR